MAHYSEVAANRRAANASALSAFGVVDVQPGVCDQYHELIHGKGNTVYTIGYEKRNGENLVLSLIDCGVSVLVDVRERPMSRVADFRGKALAARCENSGISYYNDPLLGSTKAQRDRLKESKDLKWFLRTYRAFAKRGRWNAIEELAELAATESIAMLCYERRHAECHRSVLAEFLHDEIDASVVAIT